VRVASSGSRVRSKPTLPARHELLIHREAVGIRRHGELERQFPVPGRRA